jgi:hypothetical protein
MFYFILLLNLNSFLDSTTIEMSDKETARKVGTAAAKALKKAAEGLRESNAKSDSLKIKN